MKNVNKLLGTMSLLYLFSANSFAQSCTDWENEYVQNKDNNLGINSHYFMDSGDQVAQTYHYSGEGTINAIRVHGYVPGFFTNWVPLRIRIYNVDANNRPTTPITGYIYETFYDTPSQSNVIDIPNTYVDGNFAVSIQVYDLFRTFQCLTNEPGDGDGEDLASHRDDYSSGSWHSTLSQIDDIDYYLEPLMSHTNQASFDVVGGVCHPVGMVSFDNTSIVSEDVMFNQAASVYSWDFGDGGSSNLEDPSHSYAAGSYTVTLTTTHEYFDGSTCTDTYSEQITVGMSVTAAVTSAGCYGENNGTVTPTVSNGTAPYSYWTSVPAGLTNLYAGNYTLYAEDDLGCIAAVPFTISQNPQIVFGSPTVTSATCGNPDGAILVSATGGTGTIVYSADGGSTYQSTGYFNGLEGGAITIIARDQNNCTAAMTFVIPEVSAPNITLYSLTNATCNGDSNGEIVVVGTGGSGALQYSIDGGSNYQASGTFSNLSAGFYTVLVRDAIGCTNGIGHIEITEPDAIDFELAGEPVSCFGGSNGSITISNVIGGTGLFTYSIDGVHYQSGTTFSGLVAGTYQVRARDVKGCEEMQSIVITQPAALIATSSHINPLCYEGNDGSITVSVTGGTAPYTYDITGDGNEPQAFNTFYGIGEGTYVIVVTDNHGCMTNTSALVSDPDEVTATLVVGSSTCGGSDGSIGITAAVGGSGSGYEYSSDEGATWSSVPGTISGLAAGSYDVLIRDGVGCVVGYQSTVTNIGVIPTLTVMNHSDVTCHGGNNGSITVSTGVATDMYSIGAGFQSSGVFTNLPAGTYDIIVKDVANCQIKATTITIIEPAAFVISTTEEDVTCHGDNDGSVTVTANGGGGTISYSIDGISFQSGNTISNLEAGEYDLVIQDALGCFGYSSFVIEEPTELKGYTAHLDVTCNGADNGVIYAVAAGGTPGYEYSITGISFTSSGIFSGLDGGLYTVYFKDNNDCMTTKQVSIAEPNPIALSASVTDVSCAGGDNGVIDLSVSGGTAPYTYQWTTPNALIWAEDIFNLVAGNYMVNIIDDNGCPASASYTVDDPANPLVVNGAVTDASGATSADGEVDVTVSGGTPPYFYDWSNGSTSADLTDLNPGVYTVQVTDAGGCSVSNTFTVTYSLGIGDEAGHYGISIYPNPANEVLNILVQDADVIRVELIDLQGKVVFADYSGDSQVTLSLSDFAGGIYFVNIQTDKGTNTEKVVVTK